MSNCLSVFDFFDKLSIHAPLLFAYNAILWVSTKDHVEADSEIMLGFAAYQYESCSE